MQTEPQNEALWAALANEVDEEKAAALVARLNQQNAETNQVILAYLNRLEDYRKIK